MRFDSLWINLHAATLAQDAADVYGIIKNAAIGIDRGRIAWVGAAKDLPATPEKLSDYVHDGQGAWVTPAFSDCHTHLAYAGNRADEFEQRLQGKTYAEIAKAGGGIMSTVRATRAAGEDDIFNLALSRLLPLFREGVTAVDVKSGYGLDPESERKLLRAATRLGQETGLRIRRTFLGAHALPPEFSGKADDYIDHICNDMLPALAAEGLIDAVDAFCENIAFSQEQVARVFARATGLGLPVCLHAEQLSNSGGAAMAARYGALSADHLEYLDENGVKAMAAAGTTAVLLPGAFYTLKEKQLPPVALLREHGVPMAVATDHNPGTSPVSSLLLMANMACTFFGLTPAEALAGITRNAARALGMQNERGTIETDKTADIAFFDITHPRDLAYAVGANPCRGVLLGGDYHGFV